jgi:multidrug efflux pump subunit AcrA (membrane-fusion protein)
MPSLMSFFLKSSPRRAPILSPFEARRFRPGNKTPSAGRASETTKRARAEALFKKQEQMSEGAKAMAEYNAAQQAIREKTARLRARQHGAQRGRVSA